MATTYSWHGGFEQAGVKRSSTSTNEQPINQQDLWDSSSASEIENTKIRGSGSKGQHGAKFAGLGFNSHTEFVGHYQTTSADFLFVCMYVEEVGFTSEPSPDQVYNLGRMALLFNDGGGGNPYLGIGFQVVNLFAPFQIKFGVTVVNSDGATGTGIFLGTLSAAISWPTAGYWLCLAVDKSAATWKAKLGIALDGAGSWTWGADTSLATSQAYQDVPVLLVDNRFYGGKDSDVTDACYVDDCGGTYGTSYADAPDVGGQMMLHQPTGDGAATEWTRTDGDARGHYTAVDDENDDCPDNCGSLKPSNLGDEEILTFANWVGGTLRNVRLVWEQGASVVGDHHHVWMREAGGTWTDMTASVKSGKNATAGTMCDGDSVSQWYGLNMNVSPETSSAWTPALFDGLEVKFVATHSVDRAIGEVYLTTWGDGATAMPDPTICPPAGGSLVIPRRPLAAMIGR